MLGKIETLVRKAEAAAKDITSFGGEIRVVSHYDCDGICSGAIIAKALMRDGRRFRLSFVRQLTEDVVEGISKEGNRFTIFTDLGSGQLNAIQSKLSGIVVILDHHQPQGEVFSEKIHHINTFSAGMGEHISGSGVSYLLARTISPENKDLSEIAVIGAIGDSQIDSIGPDWGLFGLNKEILKDAISAKKMSVERGIRIWGRNSRPIHKALEYSNDPYIPGVSNSESGAVHFLQELGIEMRNGDEWRTLSDLSEDETRRLASGIIKERMAKNQENPEWIFGDVYTLLEKNECSDANEFATLLNAAGKQGMGYLGVELCCNSPGAHESAQSMLESYRREISKALGTVLRNSGGSITTRKTGCASYIMAGGAIPESVISNVTSIIARSGNVPELPLFSFVDSEGNKTKISARLPDSMTGKLNLKEVIEAAAKAVGGEGGGHSNAAGANIPRGAEEMFINNIESILSKSLMAPADSKDVQVLVGNSGNTEMDVNGGRENRTEERRPEAAAGPEIGKEMERKGLVRYISP